MNFIKTFTPKETEEIKPGLFIQKTSKGYRQVHPGAWDGKMIWKNLLLGPNFLKNFIWFVIIIFLAWSYFHDVDVYQEFYEEVSSNPIAYCQNVSLVHLNQYEDTYTLQSNDRENSQGIFPE